MTFQFPEAKPRERVLVRRAQPKRDKNGRFSRVEGRQKPVYPGKKSPPNPYGQWEFAAQLTGKTFEESVDNVARALGKQKVEHSMFVDRASGLVLNNAWRTQNHPSQVQALAHIPGVLAVHNHPDGAMYPSRRDLLNGDGAVVASERGKTYITEWQWPKGTSPEQRKKLLGTREIYQAPGHLYQISHLSHYTRIMENLGLKVTTREVGQK